MKLQRIFTNWQQPALDNILQFLVNRFVVKQELDLSHCLLVFTGGKAGRRLQEKLAIYAAEHSLVLYPPRIVTTGSLPEKLYSSKVTVATELESLLARVETLGKFETGKLKKIVGRIPEPLGISSWVPVAKNITTLYLELASSLISFQEAGERIATMVNAPEDDRWEVLEEVHQSYLKKLSDVNLIDREEARRQAIDSNQVSFQGTIILCAVREINLITRRMLDLLDCPVFAIIQAPEGEQDSFDQYGSIQVEAWTNRTLNIDSNLIISAVDLKEQALVALGEVGKLRGAYHSSEIIIGHTDSQFLPYIEKVFQEAGIEVHDPSGKVLSETRFGMFLQKIKAFLLLSESRDFYELVRFPEVENYLREQLMKEGFEETDSLIAKLDRYQIRHLQLVIGKEPVELDNEDLYIVAAVKILEQLLVLWRNEQKTLDRWIVDLQKLLFVFYPNTLGSQSEIEALDSISDLIYRVHPRLLLEISGAEALELFLKLISEVQIPKDRVENEMEMLGWLELQLEDAPVVLICGMNEGLVPESVNADPYLPQAVRKHLGLLDNDRRYARDAFVLLSLINSVSNLKLIYAQHDLEGAALIPSRLLVSGKEDNFLTKVTQLYLEKPPRRILGDRDKTSSPPMGWQAPPIPVFQQEVISSLPVTAFRSYLECPYRFYLTHVLKLVDVDDSAFEMDGRIFGNLGHEVLSRFGNSELSQSPDFTLIFSELNQILDRVFLEQFGLGPLPAVIIQREQLRARLEVFAGWQGSWRKEGWLTTEIEYSERSNHSILSVDGAPFHLYGRIDRIDYHPVRKVWAVLDYKLGENTLDAEKAHRQNGEWVDLQLPLYHHILDPKKFPGEIQLGYIRLCPDIPIEKIVSIVNWTSGELLEARNCAEDIIRKLRRQEFWPPTDLNYFGDRFAAILGTSQLFEEEIDE